MLGSCNDVAERLYLQRDPSGDISVPCSDLTQHQIDALRFLFSQYKREKLGVILNYPSGCGNSVQVALFISAICEKMKKPALILYNSDREKDAWLARFARWTAITEDSIEVDTSNAFVEKQIFLKNVEDVGKFYRRSWGIVVVKGDSFMTILRKFPLKVDFKIWITAQDLKKDRGLLRLVYSWINPSDQLLQQYLDRNSPALFKEDSTNEMLLDLLLEDILFTRRGLRPFGPHKRKHDLQLQPLLIVSKKNKDATGKKIKRSKKPPEVPSTSTVPVESVAEIQDKDNSTESNALKSSNDGDATTNNSKATANENSNYIEETKMDVESFIRDNDPLQSDINLNLADSNMKNMSQLSNVDSPKAEEVLTESSLTFTSAVADIIAVENDMQTEICEDSLSLKVDVIKENVCDPTQDVNVTDDEVKNSTGLGRIDFSETVVQKVFYASTQEKDSAFKSDVDNQGTGEGKTEQTSSGGEKNGVGDQKGALEVSTGVRKEAEGSFDSKLKESEERALRKFKGSILDKIF